MTPDSWITLANSAFMIGTARLAQGVWRNRSTLKDYDLTGSFLTFAGTIFMLTALIGMNSLPIAIVAIPTAVFWGAVSWYSFINAHQ